MKTRSVISVLSVILTLSASAAGLRRLPPVTVCEGASVGIRTENAVSLKSSNTAIATASLPNDGESIVNGLKLGTSEIVLNDHRGPFAALNVTVVPSYWETLQKFFEDDPEVSVSVSGDKVIVSGRTSSHETVRRVEQSKTFDPARIISQVTYSAPAVGVILESYLHHIGYSNVTVSTVGNEVCLSGRLFDRQSITNVHNRASEFVADFPGIGVNADALKVFNQRIILDVELIQYDVTMAENLGIEWPTAISASGTFNYDWSVNRNHAESGTRTRTANRSSDVQTAKTVTDGTASVTDSSTLIDALGDAFTGSDAVNRGDQWTMGMGAKVDGVKMTVNLLKQNGASKTLYKTSIATQSGEEAKFQNGGTIHRNTQGTFSGGDLKEIEYGFIIKALPQIVDDKTVTLVVDLDNKQPINYTPGLSSGNDDITVARYQTRSRYMVRPGETILVSGFNRMDEADNKQGLPWFCHIPLIGRWLFGNTRTRNNTSEVVMVVTVNWAVENESEASVRRLDEIRERDVEVEMP